MFQAGGLYVSQGFICLMQDFPLFLQPQIIIDTFLSDDENTSLLYSIQITDYCGIDRFGNSFQRLP